MDDSLVEYGKTFNNLPETARFLIAKNSSPIFLINYQDQAILYCNGAAIKLFEYSIEELSNLSIETLKQAPEKRKSNVQRKHRRSDPTNSIDYIKYYSKSGKSFQALDQWQPTDSQNSNTYILQLDVLINDHNGSLERQKARADLAREKAQLLSLINNLPDRIYFKDRESRFIIANKATAEHIGVSDVSKLVGKTDLDCYPIKHAKRYLRDEQEIMENRRAIINYEERVKNPDGKLGWTLASKIPLIDESSGEVVGLVGISKDISEIKKNQKELKIAKELAEQSNLLKVNFIANVSHEIRTPLNAILGFSNLMKDEYEESGSIESGSYFDIITNAGDRLMRTIDMILNLSRIESGEIISRPTNIDIIPLIRQLEKEYQIIAKQKNLDLIFCIKTKRETIFSDEYALSHSLSNLIDNSLKYTNEGTITVTIDDKENGNLTFLVEDTGIGISQEYIDNLFEPYTQEETGFARKYEGIGLGLSLTKKLVTMANGEISVQSKKNIGSRFLLVFPDQEKTLHS